MQWRYVNSVMSGDVLIVIKVHTIAFSASLFFVVPSLEKQARNISILLGSHPEDACFNKVQSCIFKKYI